MSYRVTRSAVSWQLYHRAVWVTNISHELCIEVRSFFMESPATISPRDTQCVATAAAPWCGQAGAAPSLLLTPLHTAGNGVPLARAVCVRVLSLRV